MNEYEMEITRLKSLCEAAYDEINEHWDAHCDNEGYGPANLMARLKGEIGGGYIDREMAAQMLAWQTQAVENHKRAERLRKELDEQCRLLGMGGEREYILHGKLRQSERRAEAAEALALELAGAIEQCIHHPQRNRIDHSIKCGDVAKAALSDERLAKLREKKNG